ncbi:flagellar hook protein FlgE [Phenylobacterium deserti]|uniref:Flagellar hook protein FlgE n=1 Tax=Phenylobacterium deserti TaxID=1914756 RepID=A0A328AAA9_9CAUL|nr:flagellar hook protein FlgE [Phenylobacterium deserti]RAK51489.1 transposase [Phenylobacterium deserti]
MSINSAMAAGVSGLITNSSALAAISDNIANVNTVAYKRAQVNFANVVTSQAVAGRYSAGGVQGVVRHYIGQQGLVQTANSNTDLAIAGDGFFITTAKPTGLTPNDQRLYTRSGSFSVDADGYLVNDAKLYLQGWPMLPDGTFDFSPSDLSKLEPINVRSLGTAVAGTRNIGITANIDKRAALSTPIGTVPPIEMQIIDSSGGSHTLSLQLTANGANDWTAEIRAIPASDVTVNPIAAGAVVFDGDGNIDLTATAAGLQDFQIQWDAALGLQPQDVHFDLRNLTQRPSDSTVDVISQDGTGPGQVNGVQVSDDGIVSVTFDNSEVRQIARIGLATFPNPDGLKAVSGNAYTPTIPSGEMVIKRPGAGAGLISPSSLEASTVDLSAEFTGLITTQKAYSASSKIITTADQMLEELINMKR